MFSVVKFWSGPHSANPKPAAIRRFQSLVSANQLETRNCPADSNYWQSAQHTGRAWTTSHPTHHRPNEAPLTPCALPWCALETERLFHIHVVYSLTSSRHAHPRLRVAPSSPDSTGSNPAYCCSAGHLEHQSHSPDGLKSIHRQNAQLTNKPDPPDPERKNQVDISATSACQRILH